MSWSGGKDSAIALDELLKAGDYEVVSLMTTVSEEYRRISHHGVRETLLEEQAQAIGIPLEKVYLPSGESGGCTNDVYEEIMSRVMNSYKARGVQTVGFGDLFLEDLRVWREAKLAKAGMRGVFPIWQRDTTKVAHDLIRLGYKAYASRERLAQDLREGCLTRSSCARSLWGSIHAARMASFTRLCSTGQSSTSRCRCDWAKS